MTETHSRIPVSPKILIDYFTDYFDVATHLGQKEGAGVEYFKEPHELEQLGCTWENNKKNGIGRLTRISGWHHELLLEGHFENDCLNGVVIVFYPQTGYVKTEGTAKDGMWHGYIKEYSEEGEVEYEGEYVHGLRHGMGISQGVKSIYVEGQKMKRGVTFESNPNSTNSKPEEVMIERNESGTIVYRGGYDKKTFLRHGIGCEYDKITGVESFMREYIHGSPVRLIKQFWNGHMDEYDENGHCVYKGLYCGDYWSDFRRDVIGVEYGIGSEMAKKYGIYKKGVIEVNFLELQQECEELQKQNRLIREEHEKVTLAIESMGEGSGELVEKLSLLTESNGKLLARLSSIDEQHEAECRLLHERIAQLSSECDQVREELSRMKQHIDVTMSGSMNPLKDSLNIRNGWLSFERRKVNAFHELDLRSFSDIKSIIVGNYCFPRVQSCRICDLPNLERFSVGKRCFTECTWASDREDSAPWDSGPATRIKNEQRLLLVNHCPKLDTIEIGHMSYADFTRFNLSSLDSLRTLVIGCMTESTRTNESSDNFYWLTSLVLSDLPSLSLLEVSGKDAFFKTSSFILTNLPSLSSLVISASGVFTYASLCIIENLPRLTELIVAGVKSVFYEVKTLVVENLPSLHTIRISGDKSFWKVKSVFLKNLPLLEVFDISGKECLNAALDDYNGVLALSEIPKCEKVLFGSHSGSSVPLYDFSCVKRGLNVSDILFNSIRDHLESVGSCRGRIHYIESV